MGYTAAPGKNGKSGVQKGDDLSDFERQFVEIRFTGWFRKVGKARLIEQQVQPFRHRLSLLYR
jgi:hypothetical protein